MTPNRRVVALAAHLRECRNVITLGVFPNFSDYSPESAELIRSAEKIYYPSSFYADLLHTMGKEIFPSYHSYLFAQDKIKQSALFEMMKIPHPRTRVFYGIRQRSRILEFFQFPFVGKIPKGSAMGRGVFLIGNDSDLQKYLSQTRIAYIQQFLPVKRDIRVVVIGKRCAHAYWRIAPADDFRCNVSVGGTISLDPVPREALDLAIHTARSCRWNDVGIDICLFENRFYVLEANMKYGKEGFRAAGLDYTRLMEQLIEQGDI